MKRLAFLALLVVALTPAAFAVDDGCAAEAMTGIDALFALAPAALQAPEVELVATRAACTATASCGSYAPVSCNSNASSASCVGVDRNCADGQRGYVTCAGVTTVCPFCPPPAFCVEGSRQTRTYVDCCSSTKRRDEVDECQGGQWVYIGYKCVNVPSCVPR